MQLLTSSALEELVKKLLIIRDAILEGEKTYEKYALRVHPNYKYNALNFLRYLRFRTFDLREIQGSLTALGMSSLSHAERHVLANIENILYLLNAHLGHDFNGTYKFGKHPVSFIESDKKLRKNTQRLFGKHVKKMGVMVTLPSEAVSPDYLKMLLQAGMDIARINCSHDNTQVWKKMVANLKCVSEELNLPCSVYVDLAGPKIRTHKIWAPINRLHKGKNALLLEGDSMYLLKSLDSETANGLKERKKVIFTCQLPTIIDDVQQGHRILFDDGNIGGEIAEKLSDGVKIRVTRTDPGGSKLRPEKGINLPDTHLNLPPLTEEDIHNLDFVSEYADMVGFSFVREAKDVAVLQEELRKRNASHIGMVLKIENREAFENLPELILQAMESPTIGIMTARGDLAVELGAERLSEVQEEIMWLCEAALIPNIWATQVLETLAKKGIPSRAEITDAAMSVRAECVMLNKGPFIDKALHTLDDILARMEKHFYKKQGTLRNLKVAETFWGDN
ncbi:pyruvate kinase [Abyssalbus ytuae]|uniref:Pyruvate kinase n=1 Tax=Abyssalbus ytuae TaxID=2926907 RepID=A0A9E6ZX90_9FLAO|nr:pyruvate kinase [Abyssalbus ytuae]UOB16837.1 pyruvate kinase [Abyssalbus ytuae]